MSAFIVLISFVITAAMLLLTLIESYLVVGGGMILLGLGANRFTAPAAEGYFGYVIRVGVRLLFFYLVLALGVQMANQWSAALVAACKPSPCSLGGQHLRIFSKPNHYDGLREHRPRRRNARVMAISIVFTIVTIAVPHIAPASLAEPWASR